MNTIFKAAIAYLLVLFVMRLIGRRTASQQAPFDMVVLFMFGAIAVTGVLGADHSFIGAMSALFTVGMMHVVVSWVKLHSVLLERIIDGTPIVVYEEDRCLEKEMRRLRMQEADIRTAVRQEGIGDMAEVKYAIVERDGTLSIVPKSK
ncbi:MAG: DUF421 domain-containing protein [Acidobacteriota bacterium]|nr:DUF421 domain-containing protein [Acidobacteriota bacterium]